MRILISNDDGIDAPGIIALAEAMTDLGEVTVIAPDRNRSGASNSLTITQPLRINERKPNWYAVHGTPTDCVHVATTGFLDEMPDLVLSGINSDANLGDDVWYSGTVAAAMEGRIMGLPAVAFSIVRQGEIRHYDAAAEFAKRIVSRLIHDPLPESTILNVNVPDIPYSELQGVEVTRTGTRHRAEPVVKQIDPRGVPIYWVGPAGAEADAGEGTDFWAVREKKISMTPLRVDMTKYTAFEQLSQWVATGF